MSMLQTVDGTDVESLTRGPRGPSDRLDSVQVRVATLDFSLVKQKLMVKQNWEAELCDRVEGLYRQFLALHATYPETMLVPSPSLDEFWHRHILDTQKYAEDCEFVFGRFLHHAPSTGTSEERETMNEKFTETIELFRFHFGSDPRATPKDFEVVAHCGCHRCRCRCG